MKKGKKTANICANCKSKNAKKAKFCFNCGHSLGSTKSSSKKEITLSGPTVNPYPENEAPLQNPSLSGPTQPPSSVSIDETGNLILGRYKLLKFLGVGGMGKVYLGEDKKIGRKVALKRILSKSLMSEDAFKRFQREAQTIAKLNHPYIVSLYDFGEDNLGPFIVMEYIEGETLKDWVLKKGSLDEEECTDLFRKICLAVQYAHGEGIIHRDLKPTNIMVYHNEIPKVMDFGLARVGGVSELSMTGVFMGTHFYASPEQMENAKKVDQRADIYSLGAILYFMLSGESPRIIRPSQIPQSFWPIIVQAMEEKRKNRYFTVEELLKALDQCRKTDKKDKSAESKKVSLPITTEKKESTPLEEGECENCHFVNELGEEECLQCGSPLTKVCENCGRLVWVKAEKCIFCQFDFIQREEAVELLKKSKEKEFKFLFQQALELARLCIEKDPTYNEGKNHLQRLEVTISEYEKFFQQGKNSFENLLFGEAYENFQRAKMFYATPEVETWLEKTQESLEKWALQEGELLRQHPSIITIERLGEWLKVILFVFKDHPLLSKEKEEIVNLFKEKKLKKEWILALLVATFLGMYCGGMGGAFLQENPKMIQTYLALTLVTLFWIIVKINKLKEEPIGCSFLVCLSFFLIFSSPLPFYYLLPLSPKDAVIIFGPYFLGAFIMFSIIYFGKDFFLENALYHRLKEYNREVANKLISSKKEVLGVEKIATKK
ncbi:MAG: serine/threonine protein kinase [Planctomycetota bacterium]|nr:MAG: serine/threonine protein kinase [Planctomycetota bacterium]